MQSVSAYISNMSCVLKSLLTYIDTSDEEIGEKNLKIEEINKVLEERQAKSSKSALKLILETLLILSQEHQPTKSLIIRIEELIICIKSNIEIWFSAKDLLDIFKHGNNFALLLFLKDQNLIDLGSMVHDKKLQKSIDFKKYFFPEIREYNKQYFDKLISNDITGDLKKFVEENDVNLEAFIENRREGESHFILRKLVRDDNIREFISYLEHTDEKIVLQESSVFECRSLLRKPDLSHIEYSALFGSIQIFKYLFLKKVYLNLNEKILLNIVECAIQGRNYEIIHILEENELFCKIIKSNLENLLLRAGICYHNEIFQYFRDFYHINYSFIEMMLDKYENGYNLIILDELFVQKHIDFEDAHLLNKIFRGSLYNGYSDLVRILIPHPSVDVNCKNKIAFTPLFFKRKNWFIYGFQVKIPMM